MSSNNAYIIYTNGSVLEGYDADEVAAEFSATFGVSSERAARFVNTQKIIKKGLTEKQVRRYKKKLTELGLSFTIEGTAINDDSFVLVKPEPTATQTATTVNDPFAAAAIAPVPIPPPGQMACPKCRRKQVEGLEDCQSCGVTFARYNAALVNVDTSQGEAKLKEQQDAIIEAEFDEGEFSAAALIFPAIAAALGAALWAAIALGIGWQFGIVAWLIGGAIGFAAQKTNYKGDKIAVYCAVLALLAILAGKLFSAAFLQTEYADYYANESQATWQEYGDEYRYDASLYAQLNKDEVSLKQFMVDRGYSEFVSASDVSTAELNDFNDVSAPFLVDLHERGDAYTAEDFAAVWSDGAESVAQMSIWNFMWQGSGWMDFLFLFLGVSTAFKMAREGANS